MDPKHLVFELERETKNTFRYQEKPDMANPQPPVLGTLYIQRWAVGGTAPEQLHVVISDKAPE